MKKIIVQLVLLSFACRVFAQAGLFSYTVKLANGKTLTQQLTQPSLKYNNYDCYWFTKPGNDHYFFCNNIGHIGITILRGRANDTAFVYQDKYRGAQLNFEYLVDGKVEGIIRPDPDKPINAHYTTFTPSEIAITFDGPVVYQDQKVTGERTNGTISGTIHLYREGKYEKTEVAPGCNCDPTIYAYAYDPEIGRTPSDCENAVLWRIYNTIQKSLTKVIPGISYTGDGSNPPPGSILYNGTKGGLDISGDLSDVSPCNANNKSRSKVSIDAHKRMFTYDNYALYFLLKPSADDLTPKNTGNNMADVMKGYMAYADSITKLYQAKRISAEQETKLMDTRMKQMSAAMTAGQPDIDKMEIEYNLSIRVIINALYDQGQSLGLTEPSRHPVVQHKVPGAAFEISVPSVKESDGHWTKNKLYVFFGKFNISNTPSGGIKSITPVFDPAANKLTLFNTIILLDGGSDLISKAFNQIDFSGIPALLQIPHYN